MSENIGHSHHATGVVTVFVHIHQFAEGPQYYNASTHTLAYPKDFMQDLLR